MWPPRKIVSRTMSFIFKGKNGNNSSNCDDGANSSKYDRDASLSSSLVRRRSSAEGRLKDKSLERTRPPLVEGRAETAK